MATVKFYLKNPKKSGKLRADEVSIVARFTLTEKQRFQLATGERIQPIHWNTATQEVKKSFKYHIDLNLALSEFKNDLLNLYRKHTGTFQDFKRVASIWSNGDKSEKKSLWGALSKFISQVETEKDRKTANKFRTMQSALMAFNHNLTFEDINNNFYDDFKLYLYSLPNPNYVGSRLVNKGDYYAIEEGEGEVVPLLDDTVFRYFINVTTFLKWATKRGYPVDQSFLEWEIIRRQYDDVIFLETTEVQKLLAFNFDKDHVRTAIDYLLVECFCGQRISDIKRFDLKDYEDYTWSFLRYKGRRKHPKRVSIRFTGFMKPALLLLAQHNFQLPPMSEKHINESIKEGCKDAGITSHTIIERWSGNKLIRIQGPKHEFISTHTGRKTFITLALQGGVPESVVMDLTGITDTKTLKHYKGRTSDQVASDYMDKLGQSIPMSIVKTG